jgi:phosphomannomutase
VVTPVSSNSAVERSGWFERVERTRIGSPYVIEAIDLALSEGASGVVGYEANGGFLIGDPVEREGRVLEPLPTRDAVIVALAILMLAKEWQLPLSGTLSRLPARFTSSDRLKAFPGELSRKRIGALNRGGVEQRRSAIESLFGAHFGRPATVDNTDGLRITFESGEVVHLRPSGNAPELRCYNEADSEPRALEMNSLCMAILAGWRE